MEDVGYLAQLAALAVGVYAGRVAADHRWRTRGNEGFPRVESRGRLYWVNRDDRPCFRCANGWGNTAERQQVGDSDQPARLAPKD